MDAAFRFACSRAPCADYRQAFAHVQKSPRRFALCTRRRRCRRPDWRHRLATAARQDQELAVNTILDDTDASAEGSTADDLFDALAGLALCTLAASMFAVVLCGSM
jgi:hypothetical protein